MRQFAVEEVERAIRKRSRPQAATKLKAALHTRLEVAGLSRRDYLDLLNELRPLLPEIEEEFIWLNFLQDLWSSDILESRLLGLQLMYGIPDLVDAHLWSMLDHWTNSVDNWLLADWLGHVRAVALHKNPALVMRMAPWLQSVDPWRRRSALVSLIYVDPKTGDRSLLLSAQEVFAFLEPAVAESHPAVQSAMAWLLRFIDSVSPAELQQFLEQHRNRLSPHIISRLQKPPIPV